jgi:hypothetical protein
LSFNCVYIQSDIERNLGEQPIAKIMAGLHLKPSDLVSQSDEQLTFKMVARATKGRRLTPHMQMKVLSALEKAAGKKYTLKELFTY